MREREVEMLRNIHHVMVTIVGNRYSKLSSNLDKAVYISCANSLEKGMNPTLLLQVTGKW